MFVASLSSMILQQVGCALTLSTEKRTQSAQGLVRRLEYRHCTADQSRELQITLPFIRDLAYLANVALEFGEEPVVHEMFVRHFRRDEQRDRQWVTDYLRVAELEACLLHIREEEPTGDSPPVAVRCVPRNPLENRCRAGKAAFVEDQDPSQAQYIVLCRPFWDLDLHNNGHEDDKVSVIFRMFLINQVTTGRVQRRRLDVNRANQLRQASASTRPYDARMSAWRYVALAKGNTASSSSPADFRKLMIVARSSNYPESLGGYVQRWPTSQNRPRQSSSIELARADCISSPVEEFRSYAAYCRVFWWCEIPSEFDESAFMRECVYERVRGYITLSSHVV
ncbi:MAG: hypothetical protein Q9160_001181 [Pyrenula sp. 1 TL-2023]